MPALTAPWKTVTLPTQRKGTVMKRRFLFLGVSTLAAAMSLNAQDDHSRRPIATFSIVARDSATDKPFRPWRPRLTLAFPFRTIPPYRCSLVPQ